MSLTSGAPERASDDNAPDRRVPLAPASPTLLDETIGPDRAAALADALETTRLALGSARVIHVSSTMSGGGVAEMLWRLLGYQLGAGIDVRWLVIQGDAAFFAVTKRVHHLLHGRFASGPPLDGGAAEHYQAVIERNLPTIVAHVRPGDVVVLHDPQVAGLAPHLRRAGAKIIWRCHIGTDSENELTEVAWALLRPHLDDVHLSVFSRAAYVPEWLADRPTAIVSPSIDPLSVKNRAMEPPVVDAIVSHVGLRSRHPAGEPPVYRRSDGTVSRVERRPTMLLSTSAPPADAPLIVQVSRWDPLKDMSGVMESFAQSNGALEGAHLALVGPDVSGVSDDPEGSSVLHQCVEQWHRLPGRIRSRVHLMSLPVDDAEENAAIVNALQRDANVVTQKSLAEGFGLTVTEAMWKQRAVVASAVGGILDQIEDGVHGRLIADPSDTAALGDLTGPIVRSPELASSLGGRAHLRVLERFLDDRQLRQEAGLYQHVIGG